MEHPSSAVMPDIGNRASIFVLQLVMLSESEASVLYALITSPS